MELRRAEPLIVHRPSCCRRGFCIILSGGGTHIVGVSRADECTEVEEFRRGGRGGVPWEQRRWWFLAVVGCDGGIGGGGVGREEAEAVGFEGLVVMVTVTEEEEDDGSDNKDGKEGDRDNEGNEFDWFVAGVGG